jgi:ADP-ribose pyrophosphatase YjhB (NUDIX family)
MDKAVKPKEKTPSALDWADAPLESDEEAQQKLQLEKPEAKDIDDAPDAEEGKDAKKGKTGKAPAIKPKDAPDQRRINNAGRQDDRIVQERLKIGITPALMDKKTKTVYKGKFDQLHEDILTETPKGTELSDYHKGFMHKGRFIFEQEANLLTQKLWEEGKLSNSADPRPLKRVAVVAVRCGNSLLTGKRRDTGCWTNPGGSCNEGESFEDAAVRELQEETGLVATVDQLEHLTEKVYSYPDHRTQVVCYTLTLPQKEQARTMNDPDLEVERWRWVDLSPNTLELRSWNREADEDIAVNTLLEGVTA